MGTGIHELQIAMLQGPGLFHQDEDGRTQSDALAEFIALIHAPYFLQARLATCAPRLDRDLWVDLQTYKSLFPDESLQSHMADAASASVLRHSWYLTEELVVFAFWDGAMPAKECAAMARKLSQTVPPPTWETGKPALRQHLPDNPKLQHLIGERSWLVFHLLRIGTGWLQRPVRRWVEDAEFLRIQHFLKDLKVVNDAAERCIKDITEYANHARDSVHREDILHVVNDYRHVFKDLRKDALNRLNP